MFQFKAKTVDKSSENENEKNLIRLKKHEDLRSSLTKLSKLCKSLQEKGELHCKSTSAVGESLLQFQTASGDEKNSFSLAMGKFASIWSDIATLESYYCDECDVFVNAVNDFVNDILESTKRVRKGYDVAKDAYDKAFAKVAAVKEGKKFMVAKLYQVEKERAATYAVYMKEVAAMEIHLSDIDEKINYIFTDLLIKWFSAQRNVIIKSYEELENAKPYLLQLQNWCLEEERVFDEQRQERDLLRKKVHNDYAEATKKRFAEFFINVDICLACLDSNQDMQGNIVCPTLQQALVMILNIYNFQIPQPLQAGTNVATPQPIKGLEVAQNYCKENFDSIGTKLLERNLSELLVNFGDALASLEKISI